MIEKKLDDYLTERILDDFEDDEPQPIDTKIFKTFRMEYLMLRKKADDKLFKDVQHFLSTKKFINPDVEQWLADDIGEWFGDVVPNTLLDKLYDIPVKKDYMER